MRFLIDGEDEPREAEVCPTCGSLVIDWDVHEPWHVRLTDLAKALGYNPPGKD